MIIRPFASRVIAWIFAGLVILIATLIETILSDIFIAIPYLMFYAAGAVVTAYSGLYPGLFTTLASAMIINYFFQEPLYDLSASPIDTIRSCFFILVSGLTHWLFLERLTTINRLAEIETLLEAMIESAADYAIFSMDLDGGVLHWNAGAQRLFGYGENEILGKDAAVIFTPEDRAVGIPHIELENARRYGCAEDERWHIRKDNSRFWASGVVRPMANHRGQVIGFIKIARDVTERKLVEKERAELLTREQSARLQAEHANTVLQQFTAIIAHELRNPIATIKGFTSTLYDPSIPWRDEDRAESLAIMDMEADKLTDLIDQLLDLAQIQTGKLRIEPQPCGLDEIIDAAYAQLQAVTPDHQLHLDIPPDLPPVKADRNRIAQVIVNLVGNAAKFAPPRTTIYVTAKATNGRIQISVRDEGPGIPPDKREAIFEAFRQLDSDPFTKKQGVGLGLFICKSIVEAHGGSIWIEDHAPPGTTFTFSLPTG
jgi:PAS domain S-box-containing protein